MKIFRKQNLKSIFGGIAIGFVNGLLGAGGGMIAVPILKSIGLTQKQAHSNAIAIIIPITIFSAILYLVNDYVKIQNAFIYMPTGLMGAIIGTYILNKISPKILKRIFGILMVYAGIRLLMK